MTSLHFDLGSSAILRCSDLARLDRASCANVFGMILQSVGPMHHAANVPFHDSQARGKAILIRTDWDEARTEPGPYLHEELIFRLIRARVRLVGLDFGNSNCADLLANNIPVVEFLSNLKSLPKWGFHFTAEPIAQAGQAEQSTAVHAFADFTQAESS